uniref:Uncharacterized protein n=1 Tax=Streptomyces kanamyceticus TaxID=1967 RepID=Q1EQP3_STRKN|nr:hypothetical protein [Streptomyces kanamyceticus]
MQPEPHVTFAPDARHGLVARSGWEQSEVRTVLRDLGWEWEEHLHALAPPDDVAPADAGVQAALELHRHGHRTGYLQGPYGSMRLRLGEASQVFTRMTTAQSSSSTTVHSPASEVVTPTKEATGAPYTERYGDHVGHSGRTPDTRLGPTL